MTKMKTASSHSLPPPPLVLLQLLLFLLSSLQRQPLPIGCTDAFVVPVQHRHAYRSVRFGTSTSLEVPLEGLEGPVWEQRQKPERTSSVNATLPIAMMVLDPTSFPTKSKARRAIRKRKVQVQRPESDHVLDGKTDTRIFPQDKILVWSERPRSNDETLSLSTFADSSSFSRPGYPGLTYARPTVSLPVVWEDDYFAIVNKPANMICHSLSKGGYANNSVLR